MNGQYTKENFQMANEHMKMCPTSLNHQENANQNTRRYHYMTTRVA